MVGQFDSLFTHRVIISLRLLGFAYEHDTRSVFADFDAIQKINPLGRIPTLKLDSGEVLIESAAILDWLDQTVGSDRALIPPNGPARQRALQRVALAIGASEKAGAAAYERFLRPPPLRWPEWIQHCRTQAAGAIAALAQQAWPAQGKIGQDEITTACMIRYVRMVDGELLPLGKYPTLDALSVRCEARAEFRATYPAEYALPRAD